MLSAIGRYWSNAAISSVITRCKRKTETKEEETWLPELVLKTRFGKDAPDDGMLEKCCCLPCFLY